MGEISLNTLSLLIVIDYARLTGNFNLLKLKGRPVVFIVKTIASIISPYFLRTTYRLLEVFFRVLFD